MIRRIVLALLVGVAVVALKQPEDAAELGAQAREGAERGWSFCRTFPSMCGLE